MSKMLGQYRKWTVASTVDFVVNSVVDYHVLISASIEF